jgi:type I restriction enzyme S subunit
MAWPLVPLSDLCSQHRAAASASDDLPYIAMDQVEGNTGEIRLEAGSRSGNGDGTTFKFDARHVLYGKLRPYLNKVATPDFNGKCSTELVPLLPHEGTNRRFLAYVLRRDETIKTVMTAAVGARMPRASMDVLLAMRVPLPPLAEQQRIVEILDRAAAIQRLLRAAEEKAREIIPALFVDMFGDPATNPKGWPVGPLKEAADIGSGVTKGRKIDGKAAIEVPYLRVANVQDGFLDLTEIKTITILETEREKYALEVGDMVMTEGGDLDKLGRGYVWNGELPYCAHQNHVFRVRSDRAQVDPLFLAAFIQSFAAKSYFLRVAKRTTGIASINKTQLGDMPLWLPPVKLQQEFGRRVSAVNSMTGLLVSATKLGQDAAGALTGSMLAAS